MTSGRHVASLLDDCSINGDLDVNPVLRNVALFFLQPNTTSHIQSIDARTIAAETTRFRRQLLLKFFDNMDTAAKAIYNLDILSAMRWIKWA